MKSLNTYLALITSQFFWESSSCFTATWDDKLLHTLCNSLICSLASAKSVSKFCNWSIWNELKMMYKKEWKSIRYVFYIHRQMDVHTHTCIYLLFFQQIYIGICVCPHVEKTWSTKKERCISDVMYPLLLYCRNFSLICLQHVEGEFWTKPLQSGSTHELRNMDKDSFLRLLVKFPLILHFSYSVRNSFFRKRMYKKTSGTAHWKQHKQAVVYLLQ